MSKMRALRCTMGPMTRLVSSTFNTTRGVVLCLSLAACSGKAVENVPGSNHSGAGGSSAGGTSSVGGASTGGSSDGGASTGTGAVVNGPELCQLPLESGNCDGYSQVYGYDPARGHCVPFVYGLCGGNENRFSTFDECTLVCGGPGRTECATSADCALQRASCCGVCYDQWRQDDLEAVNAVYLQVDRGCGEVSCEPCPPLDGASVPGFFRAACEAGQCVVREVPNIKACEIDADCVLRRGTSCCEECDQAVDSISSSVDFSYECGAAGACATCPPHSGQYARCNEGTCEVGILAR
jgi:hypothetical protein